MSRKVEKVIPIVERNSSDDSLVMGSIDAIHEDGSVFVSLPGSNESIKVRTAMQFSEIPDDLSQLVGRDVLLNVTGRNRADVILVGLVRDTLWPEGSKAVPTDLAEKEKISIKSDGRTVTIGGEREIVMTCGKSTISLKRDGTILIKGMKVTTRAAGSNRIKGASVNIN